MVLRQTGYRFPETRVLVKFRCVGVHVEVDQFRQAYVVVEIARVPFRTMRFIIIPRFLRSFSGSPSYPDISRLCICNAFDMTDDAFRGIRELFLDQDVSIDL